MKKCPYCEEKIQESAKKCRFCGERLEGTDSTKKNQTKVISLISPLIEDKENEITSKQLTEDELIRLKAANQKIKISFAFLLISICISVGFFIYSYENPLTEQGVDFLIEMVLYIILAFGVYKKNRVASLGVLLLFIADKIAQLTAEQQFIIGELKGFGIIVALLFIKIYFHGAEGTFTYHKLNRINKMTMGDWIFGIFLLLVILLVIIGSLFGET